MENKTHEEQNKIITHYKCNIWQSSFTPITKIKTIEKGTEMDIVKAKESFKKTNKKVELKERNEKLWKDSSYQMNYSRWCDIRLHISNSYGWVQT
jgi:hypothetical protein